MTVVKPRVTLDLNCCVAGSKSLETECWRQAGVEVPRYATGLPHEEWLAPTVGKESAREVLDLMVGYFVLHSTTQEAHWLAGAVVAGQIQRGDIPVAVMTHLPTRCARHLLDRVALAGVPVHRYTRGALRSATIEKLGPRCHVTRSAMTCRVPLVTFVDNADRLAGLVGRYLI